MNRKVYRLEGKEVTQEEYLYGIGSEVPKISTETISKRVELLNKQLSVILDCDYHTRDMVREAKLIKAINFWETINIKN